MTFESERESWSLLALWFCVPWAELEPQGLYCDDEEVCWAPLGLCVLTLPAKMMLPCTASPPTTLHPSPALSSELLCSFPCPSRCSVPVTSFHGCHHLPIFQETAVERGLESNMPETLVTKWSKKYLSSFRWSQIMGYLTLWIGGHCFHLKGNLPKNTQCFKYSLFFFPHAELSKVLFRPKERILLWISLKKEGVCFFISFLFPLSLFLTHLMSTS